VTSGVTGRTLSPENKDLAFGISSNPPREPQPLLELQPGGATSKTILHRPTIARLREPVCRTRLGAATAYVQIRSDGGRETCPRKATASS
jgi:hypothetical protein